MRGNMGNMNPKQMKQAMQKLGIDQEDIEASKVEIQTPQATLVFDDPSVQKVDMMGQETYQVMGTPQKTNPAKDRDVTIDEEDITTIVDQTGCSEEKAKQALKDNDYDLAAAIKSLQD